MDETGIGQRTSKQGFLVGGGTTKIDSERRLQYLSLKPVLKFAAMSSFSSSLQTMRSTTSSTSAYGSIPTKNDSVDKSGSMLATREDEVIEKAEGDGNVGDGAGAFLVG